MKRVVDLLYLLSPNARDRIEGEMQAAGCEPQKNGSAPPWLVVQGSHLTCRFQLCSATETAIQLLRDHYYHFVVVDDRYASDARHKDRKALPLQFVERVYYAADAEHRYPRSRIVAVLQPGKTLAQNSYLLGKLQVGAFVVHPFPSALIEKLESMYSPAAGKTAVCLSGGGVEGFLFELGVIKALDAHLQGASLIDMDIFCGISSGSILAAFLANETPPTAIEAAMLGDPSFKGSEAVNPGVIFDPHYREYMARLWLLGNNLTRGRGGDIFSNLLKTVPIGFFRGNALQRFLKRQLAKPGRTDDFRRLRRELLIGSTDQDTSTHVLFGTDKWRDIPISTAVRASTALTPFFEPAKIKGRYFVDGQYTRTSNFHVAIERGARLVIIIDPLVPLRIDEPGYVRKKGGVFGGLQALKAVIHTRFMHAFKHAVQTYPEVDFVLFHPESDVMRLMSGSPMKYNIRTEIINLAYRYAVDKIQRDFVVLEGAFARHGFTLQRHPRLTAPHRAVS